MKKIIEYTFEGKTELGIVGKATPLKDDLGNELKVGDVVFFQMAMAMAMALAMAMVFLNITIIMYL